MTDLVLLSTVCIALIVEVVIFGLIMLLRHLADPFTRQERARGTKIQRLIKNYELKYLPPEAAECWHLFMSDWYDDQADELQGVIEFLKNYDAEDLTYDEMQFHEEGGLTIMDSMLTVSFVRQEAQCKPEDFRNELEAFLEEYESLRKAKSWRLFK